jgi:hypothetical protein
VTEGGGGGGGGGGGEEEEEEEEDDDDDNDNLRVFDELVARQKLCLIEVLKSEVHFLHSKCSILCCRVLG